MPSYFRGVQKVQKLKYNGSLHLTHVVGLRVPVVNFIANNLQSYLGNQSVRYEVLLYTVNIILHYYMG